MTAEPLQFQGVTVPQHPTSRQHPNAMLLEACDQLTHSPLIHTVPQGHMEHSGPEMLLAFPCQVKAELLIMCWQ